MFCLFTIIRVLPAGLFDVSSAPIRFRSVVLPDPEGPNTTTKSPLLIFRLAFLFWSSINAIAASIIHSKGRTVLAPCRVGRWC